MIRTRISSLSPTPPYPQVPPTTTREKPAHIKREERGDILRIIVIFLSGIIISILLNQYADSFVESIFIFVIFLGLALVIVLTDVLDLTTSMIVMIIAGIIIYYLMGI